MLSSFVVALVLLYDCCVCGDSLFTDRDVLSSLNSFQLNTEHYSHSGVLYILSKTVPIRIIPSVIWIIADADPSLLELDIIYKGVRINRISLYCGFSIHITQGRWFSSFPQGLLIDWEECSDYSRISSLVDDINIQLSVGTMFSRSKLFSSFYYDAERPCVSFLKQLRNVLFHQLSPETVQSLLLYPFFSLGWYKALIWL